MSVAIQGQRASFHDQAARSFFGPTIDILPCDTFQEVFTSVTDAVATHGVVAIENSLYGSINPVYDLLLHSNCRIVGETYLRVELCLIGLPDARLEQIYEVHSQVFALSESEDFLDKSLPKAQRFEEHDTAASVAMIKKWGDPHKAAIASRQAAELHGMQIIESGIETHHENYTRFVIISTSDKTPKDANKTSLVLTTTADTKPGSLHAALGAFARHDINLTMLQSRPLIGKAWHYLFYVDLLAASTSPHFQQALDALDDLGFDVTILGSYASGRPL